jgi:general secretion pathway protein G
MKDFPTTEQGLEALVRAPEGDATARTEVVSDNPMRDASASSTTSGWDGPYVNQESIPKDPWGGTYQYEYPPTHGSGEYPDIWSFGPDGQDGTEDDIVSWSNTDGSTDATSSEMEPTRPTPPKANIDE